VTAWRGCAVELELTLAICINCGARKFGALVPCKECGAVPRTVAEKAKSLTLSDHNFPPAELRKMSEMLKTGGRVPYSPVGLAACAHQIVAQDYYWQNVVADSSGEILPCMQCGQAFQTLTDGVLCPACEGEESRPIPFCPKCVAIHEPGKRFCSKCGNAIALSNLRPGSLALSLMLGVERVSEPTLPVKGFDGVAEALARLTSEESVNRTEEMKWLAIHSTSVLLRENATSARSVGMEIYQHLADLYVRSLAFREIEDEAARRWATEVIVRLDEYDKALGDFVSNPEFGSGGNWMLALAVDACEHCYPGVDEGIAALQLTLEIGFFMKVQRDVLKSAIARRG
jgi:hypothetical protein